MCKGGKGQINVIQKESKREKLFNEKPFNSKAGRLKNNLKGMSLMGIA